MTEDSDLEQDSVENLQVIKMLEAARLKAVAAKTKIVARAEEYSQEDEALIKKWFEKPQTQDYIAGLDMAEKRGENLTEVGIVFNIDEPESNEPDISHLTKYGRMRFTHFKNEDSFDVGPEGFQIGDVIQVEIDGSNTVKGVKRLDLKPEKAHEVLKEIKIKYEEREQ